VTDPPAEQPPKRRRRWVPIRRDAEPGTADGVPLDEDGWAEVEEGEAWQWDRRQWR
jgi:hypothetical protein